MQRKKDSFIAARFCYKKKKQNLLYEKRKSTTVLTFFFFDFQDENHLKGRGVYKEDHFYVSSSEGGKLKNRKKDVCSFFFLRCCFDVDAVKGCSEEKANICVLYH